METQRRLPIQARRPVVKYLPKLPDEALHIIDLFLRKPHPTAVMIAETSFRRLNGVNGKETVYIVHGPLMRFGGGCNAIVFRYYELNGECYSTRQIARRRIRDIADQFYRDQRIAELVEEFRGMLPVSLIEFVLHVPLAQRAQFVDSLCIPESS